MPEHPHGEPAGLATLVAEFSTPEAAAKAARCLRNSGFGGLDAYGPFPSEELAEAIGFREHRMAPWVLAGGVTGGVSGFALQYYTTVIGYPHNIGGRPHFSWPSYIPIIFECTILLGTLTGVVALLILNRLPRLAHPIFSAANFERASTDHFFLAVNAEAPEFNLEKVRELIGKDEAPISISLLMRKERPA